jgi:beta-glucosidase
MADHTRMTKSFEQPVLFDPASRFPNQRDRIAGSSLTRFLLIGAVFFWADFSFSLRAEDSAAAQPPLWKNPNEPSDTRVRDLVKRMTLEEKAIQVCNRAPAIPRLGLPAYDYWNECLHGVARNGVATVFPQAIGMAATWDAPLLHEVADVIATEARAKNREYTEAHNGDSANYVGLTFWSPNINIFRDPRWGRGQETYGEDPFLTARLAVAFIQGLQGDDPKYMKAMACAKHFAIHSGPEAVRHQFNAEPPERDLYETYLPQFEAAVREGHVGAVMGAYNRVYGQPACASSLLLSDLLRREWGFSGHVVSDCGAIYDMVEFHKYVPTFAAAAALAVKAGCDLTCGSEYRNLTNAVNEGLITESEIDVSLGRILEARFRLGLFDPPASVPYAQIPTTENDTPEHAALALRVARESIVLLKNDGLLPLNRAKLRRIAVIGANANSVSMLLGNYFGTPSHPVTILDGIRRAVGTNSEIIFEPGCPLSTYDGDTNKIANAEATARAVAAAKSADVVIYVGGLSPELEGEDLHVAYDGFHGGDRTRIELADVQINLLKALHATGRPVVFVNCSGSAVAMPWAAKKIPAIVQAWYPGQSGGQAVAEVLFGDANPAGRLPVTFYRSTEDLPAFTNYAMVNRTYRYFSGKPLFAFGHGLSYTQFKYKSARLDRAQASASETVRVSVELANAGASDSDEVVQVYFRHVRPAVPQAREALCGFRRVAVSRGQTAQVEIEVPMKQFRHWDVAKKQYVVEPGQYEILVGAASDDIRAKLPLSVVPQK